MLFVIMTSVFNKSRKPVNFAVYCNIFSGYFISDKNRSVLFRDQLYVFWDCLYSGSVFDSVCFNPFFRFETGNQLLLDLLKSFPWFKPGEFSVLNMYNYLTPQNRTTWETAEISLICLKRSLRILNFFQSAKQSRGLYFINLWSE